MDELAYKWDCFMAGDEDAFTWLYENCTSFLYEYGMRFTSDTNLVKDCIHDLFLSLYKNRKSIIKPHKVKVYLLVSLKNRLFNVFKHAGYTRFIDNEDGYTFNLIDSVEKEYIDTETNKNIQKAVETLLTLLSPRQKEIIYYRYIQELDMNEICELMNLSYQSGQNLIQKAFHKMRAEKENELTTGKGLNINTVKLLSVFF